MRSDMRFSLSSVFQYKNLTSVYSLTIFIVFTILIVFGSDHKEFPLGPVVGIRRHCHVSVT